MGVDSPFPPPAEITFQQGTSIMAHKTRDRETFFVEIIKPSHYDDDGYVIQWLRAFIPSNSLACLYALALRPSHDAGALHKEGQASLPLLRVHIGAASAQSRDRLALEAGVPADQIDMWRRKLGSAPELMGSKIGRRLSRRRRHP
jgi:hypothetical protein